MLLLPKTHSAPRLYAVQNDMQHVVMHANMRVLQRHGASVGRLEQTQKHIALLCFSVCLSCSADAAYVEDVLSICSRDTHVRSCASNHAQLRTCVLREQMLSASATYAASAEQLRQATMVMWQRHADKEQQNNMCLQRYKTSCHGRDVTYHCKDILKCCLLSAQHCPWSMATTRGPPQMCQPPHCR